MIETLINSKTRIKILKFFLSHIDDRYYLRELERLLEESLSPLRRQLLKLVGMGILVTEEEANLKYYRLNKNYEGLEELKELVIGKDATARAKPEAIPEIASATPKQFRYDLVALSFISVFVLMTATFVLYSNTKSIKQVARMISKDVVLDSAAKGGEPRSNGIISNTGEMISRKWKLMPGNIPVFFEGETGEEKRSKEL